MLYEIAEKALRLEREGKRIIRLNVGDTNLPTPEAAKSAAVESIGGQKAGYGSSAGLYELRQMAAEREGCAPENIVVGPGSKLLIYGLLSTLCAPGDKVTFPSPHWPAYSLACRQLGLKEDEKKTSLGEGWGLGEIDLDGSRMLIICNPLNPTSTTYKEKELREIIGRAEDEGIPVLLDEAYKGIAFERIPDYDAIRIRSFSKEFNMEGWRLGYVVAPEEVAKKLIRFNQITCTCVPRFVQEAGMACLREEEKILEANRKVWRSRMETACKALEKHGFAFARPDAGMYVFATHEKIRDSGKFALSLLDEGVAVTPGISFGDFPKFIRICANRPENILDEAMEKMASHLR